MTKVEFISRMAEETGFTKKDLNTTLDALVKVITESIVAGDEVRLNGIGTFTAKEVPARECRNPQSGEVIQVAAHKTPKFKAAKALKDAVK